MISIDPPRDNGGVRRRLRRTDTAAVARLYRSAPGAAPREPGAQGCATAPLAGHEPRRERGPERRVNERRRRRAAVLLDTRSTIGNRRRGVRRGSDRSAARPRGPDTGIPPAGTILDDDARA